jgi:probable aminopeptidase NPEPL1
MVQFGTLAALSKRVNRVLVVGSVDTLQQQAGADSFLQQTLARAAAAGGAVGVSFAAGANPVLLRHAIAHLKPGTDAGDSAEVLLVRDSDSDALHVTLHALPTLVSRANSLARPHSIASFVKKNRSLVAAGTDDKSDEAVLVVLVLPQHKETWFAAGAAVARSAPQYTHKLKTTTGLPLSETKDEDALTVVYENSLSDDEAALAQHTANAIQLSQRLVDAPPNELHSDAFVAEALAVAKQR